MESRVRAALEELIELGSLEQREGRLSTVLNARRQVLEKTAAEFLERQKIPSRDLKLAVAALSTREKLLPGVYNGLGSWFGDIPRSVYIICQLMAGLGLCLAGAMGPLYGEPFQVHIATLLRGPIVFCLVVWGGMYPIVIAQAERKAEPHYAFFPRVEGTLIFFGMLVLGGWLTYYALPLIIWCASGLVWVSFALASISIVRRTATDKVVSALARRSVRTGYHLLESYEAPEARLHLEFAVALRAPSIDEEDVIKVLRVATLIEAEGLRASGYQMAGRALLWARGIEPSRSECMLSVVYWHEKTNENLASLFEATGLYMKAAERYRELDHPSDAIRCYQEAAYRATESSERHRALVASIELGGDADQYFLRRLLDDIEVEGPAANAASRVMAALPPDVLESRDFLVDFARRLEKLSGGYGVGLLEAVVGVSTINDRPGLYSLLADAYGRLGHRSTARRLRSELGNRYTRWGAADFAKPESAPDTSDLAEALVERYHLRTRLGGGSMGVVYLADDVVLERQVALKVLNPKLMSDIFVEKFRAEARVVARLDHPNIVSIFDAGQTDSWLYFVMEFVDGPDLGSVMDNKNPLPSLGQRIQWGIEVAEAMAYAHSRGVIHRDLKPANVLINSEGQARVTDFGVARVTDTAPYATAFSRAGLQVGTPPFMAPEQLTTGGDANVLTDVYALGTTLYFLVSKQLPYEDDPMTRLEAPAPSVKDLVPSVSEDLNQLIRSALEPNPSRRLYGMQPFAERLKACPELKLS